MNTRVIVGVAIIVIIAIISIAVVDGQIRGSALIPKSTVKLQPSGGTGQTGANLSKTLFVDTPYAHYAYQVYPGPESAQAQAALSGFNVTSTVLQNGTVEIKLSVLGINQSRMLMLSQNYKLYVIETSPSDDTYHFDASLGDDGFVVVDPQGYVA